MVTYSHSDLIHRQTPDGRAIKKNPQAGLMDGPGTLVHQHE